MQLSESAEGDGAVTILVRVDGAEVVDQVHQGLVALSRVEEVRCRRDATGSWLLAACGVPNADPDRLLQAVAAVVDRFDFLAEVIDVRRGATELPGGGGGYRISARFAVAGAGASADAETICLDAAHVFGTGVHASTRLAVEAMEEIADKEGGLPARILDVGTGSGVLALIAARLGGEEVLGIDICEDAVSVARRNVLANDLARQVTIASTPLTEVDGGFKLIIANVTASVCLRLAADIMKRLLPGGRLIVSGLQGRQGEELESFFAGYGLQTVNCYAEGKWRCLTLCNGSAGQD